MKVLNLVYVYSKSSNFVMNDVDSQLTTLLLILMCI